MVDRYTKAVLTVIAGSLVVLVLQNAIQKSPAQDLMGVPLVPQPLKPLPLLASTTQRVAICDETGLHCLGLAGSFGNLALPVQPQSP